MHTVGLRKLMVPDTERPFPTWVMYPTREAPRPVAVGAFTVEAALEAPPCAGRFPVLVMSHGSGSRALLHRVLALGLARRGFVVALPEHPGNNREDNSLADTDANLVSRPRHVCQVLSALEADPTLGAAVDLSRLALGGHSIGGYTALAVAGGTPWARPGQPLSVPHDARVKALVLLAPATPWFMPEDSLRSVTAPILLVTGAEDTMAPAWHADLVVERVPDASRVSRHSIPGAAHYSFLSPFPPEMRRPDFPPSVDLPGFDRERFHAWLVDTVGDFLARTV